MGVASPKMFGTQFSPIASATWNIRDTFTPSVSGSSRNTYLPPSKGLQNTTNQVTRSQPSSLALDVRNALLQASKMRQSQESQVSGLSPISLPTISSPDASHYHHRLTMDAPIRFAIEWDDEWGFPIAWNMPYPVETNDSAEIVELFIDYDDETGAMILRDRDGNVVSSDVGRERTSIWDIYFGMPGKKQAFYEKLEANPGLVWRFDFKGANRDFEGHDILDAIFPKVFSCVWLLNRTAGEYGYIFRVPAFAPAWMSGKDGVLLPFHAWSAFTQENGTPLGAIKSEDRSGLAGLTLEERDIFYAEVQKIFDRNGINRDAHKTWYTFLPSAPKDLPRLAVGCNGQPLPEDFVWTPFPGGWIWGGVGFPFNPNASYSYETIKRVQGEMIANPTLRALFEKAEGVRNGTIADDTLAQQYSIRVTDNEGNRLANDRIIIEAKNGNQIEMSVEQFSQMSRLDITILLR